MGRVVGGSNGISSGLCGGKSYQRFTASGDWIKPAGASVITFEIIGGGGAGSGGWAADAPGNDVAGGGGGGGGAMKRYSLPAASVPNFLTVVVGELAEGTVGSGTAAGDGEHGNNSSISDGTFTLTSYGGRGSDMGPGSASGVGGGGGGTGSIGDVGSPTGASNAGTAGAGGAPFVQGLINGSAFGSPNSNHHAAGGGGGSGVGNSGGTLAASGKSAEFGGGGGGSSNNCAGGGSIFGGGAGGGSGGWHGFPTSGGAWGNFTQGGADNGYENGDTFPVNSPAAAGDSRAFGCGDGGAGLHDNNADNAAELGGQGGNPGGGGGSSGKNTTGHVRGGHGSRGEVRIWSW